MSLALRCWLERIPGLRIEPEAPLARYTRFGLGGPARLLIDAKTEPAFLAAYALIRESEVPLEIIGGGSNLVVSDEGFDGAILRFTAGRIWQEQDTRLKVEAGCELQRLVDFSIGAGLAGIHTMTGIPGWVGGAIYGNAGAYGRSIDGAVVSVRYFDGRSVGVLDGRQCEFHYRESIFKRRKNWTIFSAGLALEPAIAGELRQAAAGILEIRNAKYPPSLRCAGSIFKNLIFAELPDRLRHLVEPKVIREGKVASAYFLELAGAKGLTSGGAHVADYHANLIYSDGSATAAQVCELIAGLKRRVQDRFDLKLEEEVQYIGFGQSP